jgi:hypothetical protein
MKQHKTVNINVKVKLNRIPSAKEKRNLVEKLSYTISDEEPHQGLYGWELKDSESEKSLKVENHCVTVRKMGI